MNSYYRLDQKDSSGYLLVRVFRTPKMWKKHPMEINFKKEVVKDINILERRNFHFYLRSVID